MARSGLRYSFAQVVWRSMGTSTVQIELAEPPFTGEAAFVGPIKVPCARSRTQFDSGGTRADAGAFTSSTARPLFRRHQAAFVRCISAEAVDSSRQRVLPVRDCPAWVQRRNTPISPSTAFGQRPLPGGFPHRSPFVQATRCCRSGFGKPDQGLRLRKSRTPLVRRTPGVATRTLP